MLFMLNSWSCFSADTPRAEYPRPQFEREQWLNLNGTWTFDFDFGKSGKDRRLQSAEKFSFRYSLLPFATIAPYIAPSGRRLSGYI